MRTTPLEEPGDLLQGGGGTDLKIDDYASRDISKQNSLEMTGKVTRKRLKKFKSDTFGGVFTFNSGSGENCELTDGQHHKMRNKRPTDLDFQTYFQKSESIEEIEEKDR